MLKFNSTECTVYLEAKEIIGWIIDVPNIDNPYVTLLLKSGHQVKVWYSYYDKIDKMITEELEREKN